MRHISTWAAARFQLRQCSDSANSKFWTACLRIKGGGAEKGDTCSYCCEEGETVNWPMVGQDWYFGLGFVKVRTIL